MADKMCYVYVIRSSKNNRRYTGYTAKEPAVRLTEHNSGTNVFTRVNGPYVLLYQEKFTTKRQAMEREKYLKTGQGRKFLDRIIPP